MHHVLTGPVSVNSASIPTTFLLGVIAGMLIVVWLKR